jgi:hypothetical protein
MSLRTIIKKVLKEEVTETDPLWYKVPNRIIDELGIELYFPDDEAYVVEIHFDTRNVLIGLYTHDDMTNEIMPYSDSHLIPGNFEEYYQIPLDELPLKFKTFIFRRLDPKYHKYL